jgi:hypothetical protein
MAAGDMSESPPLTVPLKDRLLIKAQEKVKERRAADLDIAARIADLVPTRAQVVDKLLVFAEVEGETLEESNEIVCNVKEAPLPVGDIFDLDFVNIKLGEFWDRRLNEYLKDEGFSHVAGFVEVIAEDMVRFDVDIRLRSDHMTSVDEGGFAQGWEQTLEEADIVTRKGGSRGQRKI